MQRLFVGIALLSIPGLVLAQQGSWTETTQADFADGWYERDIYCSFRGAVVDPDTGAVEFVPRFDFTGDGWIDLVVSNKPNAEEASAAKQDWIYIYYYGDERYNTNRSLDYPTHNGAEIEGADLDLDGYTDFIVSHYYSPTDPNVGSVTIYWGTASGPSPTDTTMLPAVQQTEAVYIADLNRDGWIDILSGDYSMDLTTTTQDYDSMAIFWGGPDRRYSREHATYLPARTGRHNFQVADFDQDGFYDILLINYFGNKNFIYWGLDPEESGGDYYRANQRTELDYLFVYPHGATTADFDEDGYLDLVFTGMQTIEQAYVYYGDGTRDYQDPTVLETGKVFGGCAAFDYNYDGWLDLIFYRGDAGDTAITSKFKPWIYYGGPDGFSDEDRIEMGLVREYNLSGGFLTDFDADGILDIFIHSWNLFDASGVLWGPDYSEHTQLYCNVDHHAQCRDVGHVYDRRFERSMYWEPYVSNVFDAGESVNWDAIVTVDSTFDDGSRVSELLTFIRTGPTPEPDESWTEWIELRSNGTIPDLDANGDTAVNRYFQYQANLTYSYAGMLPVLYEVTTYWGPGLLLVPDSTDTTYPGVEIVYPLTVTNEGFASDVINVTTRGTRTDWQITLYDSEGNQLADNNSDGVVDLDSVPGQGSTALFNVGLTPPDDAMVGDLDSTVVTVHSTNNETVSASAKLITHVAPLPALYLAKDSSLTAYGGETVRYRLKLTNSGNGPDSVYLTTQRTRENWSLAMLSLTGDTLLGTDQDTADLGTLPIGEVEFFADVTIPPDAMEGERDSTRVIAHSSVDPELKPEIMLVTIALVPPDTIPVVALNIEPDTLLETRPQTPVEFLMSVQNLGNRTDTIDIELEVHQPDWDYQLLAASGKPLGDANHNGIPDVGTLEPSEFIQFLMQVTPPPGVGDQFTGTSPKGNTTVAVLTARSSVGDTVTDEAQDTVVVIPDLNVHNFPNPFRRPTTFYFSLPEPGRVTLRIYNRAGEYLATVVADHSYQAGVHFEPWDGNNSQGSPVAPGILIYSFQFVPDEEDHKPRTIVKKALCQGGGL